ncbi:MAG: hypothetical protein V4574_05940 [Pseudomonadota bacterium]
MASALDGVFLIDAAGRTVRCFAERPHEDAWLDVLVRRVLPRVAMLFGATTIHGAAAVHDGAALLLLGESGAGKSTLSAYLGSAGWGILSDDISILWDPEAPLVAPATTGVCVWADSRAGLALPEALCRPLTGYPGKVRYVPGGEDATDLVPLKALVFLARSDVAEPVLQPVPPGEGLIRAAHQRIRFNPADATGAETIGNFERLTEIVRVTPCHRLCYPADYGALPRVAAMLEQVLRA